MISPYKQAFVVALKSGRVALAVVEATNRPLAELAARAAVMADSPKDEFWSIAAYPTGPELALGVTDFSVDFPGIAEDSDEPAKMKRFTFSMEIRATIHIDALTEEDAIERIEDAEMKSANLGAFRDGEPVLVEIEEISDAGGGDWSACFIDGEETFGR